MKVILAHWKKLAAGAAVTLLVGITFQPLMDTIVRQIVLQRCEQLSFLTGQHVTFKTLSIQTWTEIQLTGFRIGEEPDSDLSVVHIDTLRLGLFPLGFFSGSYLRALRIDSMQIRFVRRADSTDNFRRLIRSIQGPSVKGESSRTKENLNDRMAGLLDRRIPTVQIRALRIEYDDMVHDRQWILDQGRVELSQQKNKDARVEISGRVMSGEEVNAVHVWGLFDHAEKRWSATGLFDSGFRIPILGESLGIEVTVGSFEIGVRAEVFDDRMYRVALEAHVGQLGVYSSAISGKRVSDLNVRLHANLDMAGDSVHVREAKIELGRIELQCRGFVNHVLDRPHVHLQLKVPMIKIRDFLTSLPDVFSNRIRTARVDGSLEFTVEADVNWAHPDSVRLDPHLVLSPDFRVHHLGDSVDVYALRDTFTYVVSRNIEGDTSFVVGPSNPWFVPYDSIPEVLIQAVVLSEDGSFFKNDGFNILQIERSLGHNIKSGTFSRGASTISMQLSKNLFLSREKTLARKFQEIVITWLWNHDSMLDRHRNKEKHKKRLMEIYLNIIEWGPDVYGIGSAAQFYFQKAPQALTVSECVFLATIIPNPKKYERYFDHGFPRKSHVSYMNLIKKLLFRNSFISEDTMNMSFTDTVRISGSAAAWIEGYDTTFHDGDTDLEYKESLLSTPKP